MKVHQLLSALCLLAAQAIAQQPGANQDQVPAVQESGDYYILTFAESSDAANQLNLEDFVQLCTEATGKNFTYTEETRRTLAAAHLIMSGQKRIPKSDFYAFFQIQMFLNDFVVVEVGKAGISVFSIQGTTGQRAGLIKTRAVSVLPSELPLYADEPATVITTVLNLPNTDVRALSTSFRQILADANTQNMIPAGEHSVILQGFGSYVVSLAKLLELVDMESRIETDVQPTFDVVPLEYAAAEQVADLMEQLIEARQQAARRAGQPQTSEGVSGTLRGGGDSVKILVYARTNSLLVMALPEEMPRIKDLIARLDTDVIEPERNFHVYSLQNVKAEDISDVLDQFLSDSERLTRDAGAQGGQAPAAGGQSTRQNNEVVVVPDEKANALLIAANKTRYEEVLELIRQLDQRQDQVLIETALIELSGTDFRDIGVELAFADVMGNGGFGATSFDLSTFTDSDGDGIPDLRVPNILDGVTAGILSGDDVNLPFLVAAIDRWDGSNVLNVPSVLVNNNEHASVTTLDEVPTTTVTLGGGVGGQTQESFRAFEEAGITLEITPSISASRYLRLDVYLKVSVFTGNVQQVSTIPPGRTTRELRTAINVPDGDTMVIGGIITDNETETDRKTPFLGDIPLLGILFGRSAKTQQRTTLYFFVTPHIMRDRDFADLKMISEKKKHQAAEVMGTQRMQIIDDRFGRSAEELDLGIFHLPLYRSPARGEVTPEEVGLDPARRAELLERAEDESEPLEPPVPEPEAEPAEAETEEKP